MGSKDQNSTFSEHGHVAYQIKDNHECSNMVANILPADPPPPSTLDMRSVGLKVNFFRTWSCCISNLRESRMQQHGSKYVASRPPYHPPPPPGSGMEKIGQNSTFSEYGHIAYQIKLNHKIQQHGSKYFARRPPPPPT